MIVDTSVFVAFYDKNDRKHSQAAEVLVQAEKAGKIFVSDYIVNETATVILRKVGLEKSKQILETLLNSENVIVGYTSQDDFNKTVEVFRNQNGSLSFVDCSIVAMARMMKMKVATFDKNLLTQIEKTKR